MIKLVKKYLFRRKIGQVLVIKDCKIVSRPQSIFFNKHTKMLYKNIIGKDTILVLDFKTFNKLERNHIDNLSCKVAVLISQSQKIDSDLYPNILFIDNIGKILDLHLVFSSKIRSVVIYGSNDFMLATTHMAKRIFITDMNDSFIVLEDIGKFAGRDYIEKRLYNPFVYFKYTTTKVFKTDPILDSDRPPIVSYMLKRGFKDFLFNKTKVTDFRLADQFNLI